MQQKRQVGQINLLPIENASLHRIRELKARERNKLGMLRNRLNFMSRKTNQNERNIQWANIQMQKLQRNKENFLRRQTHRQSRFMTLLQKTTIQHAKIAQKKRQWRQNRTVAINSHLERIRQQAHSVRQQKSEITRRNELNRRREMEEKVRRMESVRESQRRISQTVRVIKRQKSRFSQQNHRKKLESEYSRLALLASQAEAFRANTRKIQTKFFQTIERARQCQSQLKDVLQQSKSSKSLGVRSYVSAREERGRRLQPYFFEGHTFLTKQ